MSKLIIDIAGGFNTKDMLEKVCFHFTTLYILKK